MLQNRQRIEQLLAIARDRLYSALGGPLHRLNVYMQQLAANQPATGAVDFEDIAAAGPALVNINATDKRKE